MNIDELAADLPNGLHDALLLTVSSDAVSRHAEFVLDVWIGDLHNAIASERERRRKARLELVGLAYLVFDDPDPRYGMPQGSPVQIDLCGADQDPERARQVPDGAFAARFFVTEWNGFIHFAAREARLIWMDVN
jgi:hypothetical protein